MFARNFKRIIPRVVNLSCGLENVVKYGQKSFTRNIAPASIRVVRYSQLRELDELKPVNIGVIGCGRIAQVHIKNLFNIRGVNLHWLVDNKTENIEQIQRYFCLQHVNGYNVDRLDGLLDDPSLDGVLVLSSTSVHTEQCCQVLKKGKAVFVEKPAGETIQDISHCFETAEKQKQVLVTGYNRRFDASFQELYSSFHNGSIGKPIFIKLTSRDCPRPSIEFLKSCDQEGCNLISDMAIHDIDTLVWLTKAEQPESVFVQTHIHHPDMVAGGWEDAVMMMLKYTSGIIACIDVVRESKYGYDIRVEDNTEFNQGVIQHIHSMRKSPFLYHRMQRFDWIVFGDQGQLTVGPCRTTSLRRDKASGSTTSNLQYSFLDRFEKAYKNELEHFIQCVRGKEKSSVKKDESLMTWLIIEKALESWRNKNVVYF
ncbi:hypothetical protein LOTGIDRAFT_160080 [Lottia gigantea]|uniref:Gfo/Idh/MocA-like oxidoreductase N-terminal domain-containing protein n=1 Tax=Lottia gigantea TaxID=225164 RepID=V4AMU7_LOTGI|nr:hypothetical protein LOTGIDRAFT_160080 [Lottia gigantea]ESO96095.1 hypothetical protein LOTGIDRAFT_160080 [Lottia gigantea]